MRAARFRFALQFAVAASTVLSALAIVQVTNLAPLGAAPDPAPAACGIYPNYDYKSKNCWGNAITPPAGCITGAHTINVNDIHCTNWVAQIPKEGHIGYNPSNDQTGNDQGAVPPISGLDPKVAKICNALYQNVNQTKGGTKTGPFANLYISSGCGTNAKTDIDSVCISLNTLSTYASADGTAGRTATATGLTPTAAKALSKQIDGSFKSLGCPAEDNPLPPPMDPSTADIERLVDGLEFYALLICVAVIFVSAALWAAGSHGKNPGQELTGKRGIVVSLTAAVLIGGIPAIMNFITLNAKNRNVDIVQVLQSPINSTGSTAGSTGGTP